VASLVLLAWMSAARAEAQAHTPSADNRYTLANGCFALRSEETGQYVRKTGNPLPIDPFYDATAASVGNAEKFRMQATALGSYLFYSAAPDFLARNGVLNNTAPANQPSNNTDWTITEDGGAFRVVNEAGSLLDRDLAVDGAGVLTTVPEGSGGDAGLFTFEATTGCADYPEIEVNVTGEPRKGPSPDAPVTGLVEGHLHHMAFEFLGGGAHCGRPWHRFGAPSALEDCVDHAATVGCGAILETALSGSTCHAADGWPTFSGWPRQEHLTHEQTYYKWVERAYRAGLRIFVNLLVENRVLCELYPLGPGGSPLTKNSCDEMDSVRLQVQRAHALEDYIDAQNGGPGKGWYRIVDDPVEARHVINDGKLAVVLGMEVSEPFGCRLMLPAQMNICTNQMVDDGIDELYDLGIRQLELINKFDNGLAGVAGDSGTTGVITNTGNLFSTGSAWDLEHCDDPVNHDHSPEGVHNVDESIANGLHALLPSGLPALPIYPAPPHCNQLGLSTFGERAVRRIADKGMIFDPDHMSVIARNSALDVAESENYPGLISSHSWSTDNALPRIYSAGGVVTPYAGDSQSFVDQWRHIHDHGYDDLSPFFGIGYGADMNGFGSQGDPRGAGAPNPVTYPFKSFDCTTTIHQQRSGQRTYDINVDGVAHYGLYPDWIEDLRKLAGQEIINDLAMGAEAYLRTWEAATGTPHVSGQPAPVTDCGSGAQTAGNPQSAQSVKCAALRAQVKKAKSKKAKRKLRNKLRKRGCVKRKKGKRKKKKRAR
jgi:microsomal dipeptidase-like Zn-dependent dipeptidase